MPFFLRHRGQTKICYLFPLPQTGSLFFSHALLSTEYFVVTNLYIFGRHHIYIIHSDLYDDIIMRNPFALTGTVGDDTPSQIFGYRIYLLALSATWVLAL